MTISTAPPSIQDARKRKYCRGLSNDSVLTQCSSRFSDVTRAASYVALSSDQQEQHTSRLLPNGSLPYLPVMTRKNCNSEHLVMRTRVVPFRQCPSSSAGASCPIDTPAQPSCRVEVDQILSERLDSRPPQDKHVFALAEVSSSKPTDPNVIPHDLSIPLVHFARQIPTLAIGCCAVAIIVFIAHFFFP